MMLPKKKSAFAFWRVDLILGEIANAATQDLLASRERQGEVGFQYIFPQLRDFDN